MVDDLLEQTYHKREAAAITGWGAGPGSKVGNS